MGRLETFGYKVRSYEIIGQQPSCGVEPEDTLRKKSIEAQLMHRNGKLGVNVSDFDPDSSIFLDSRWKKLGFFMGITSVGAEFTDEAISKGYDPEEVLSGVAPELGLFSVLTVAKPSLLIDPSLEEKLEEDKHLIAQHIPDIFVRLDSRGESRVYLQGPIDTEETNKDPMIFHDKGNDPDKLLPWYVLLAEDTISPSDYENLREVHDLLEQQAIDHVVEAANLPAAEA